MKICDFRRLIRWCDAAENDDVFWRRLYYAAFALDLKTQLLVQAFVVQYGTLPVIKRTGVLYR
jgi:hypothetical protein